MVRMLGEYFEGTVPQLIERARLLKGKIPRGLPRDYETLISACARALDDIIGRLYQLETVARSERAALQHAQLRKFRRAVADLDDVETTGIAVLNRAHEDDHQANRLLYRICKEIRYPWVTPTVTTLSTGYFYIHTKLNLMFIPPAEGSFLLHLPDLYHELAHPLLTRKNDPVLDKFVVCFMKCTAKVHDYFAGRRETEETRRGPRGFGVSIDQWEILWTKYWLMEFFCDLFAAATLGPAFAWSHLHLYLKMGADAFSVSSAVHPADDARMRAVLGALRLLGFRDSGYEIETRWGDALRLSDSSENADYMHCYPDELISFVVEQAIDGVAGMDCRLASAGTDDCIHSLLNGAWRRFWKDPGEYHRWEAEAVQASIVRHKEGG